MKHYDDLIDALQHRLYVQFKRREWVANVADPTVVIEYKATHVTFLASWGVEMKVYAFKRTWRSYDSPLARWIYGLLEQQYEKIQGLTVDHDIDDLQDFFGI